MLAAQMLRVPISALQPVSAAAHSAADLRKFLLQLFERNIDKKLVTRGMLEKLPA